MTHEGIRDEVYARVFGADCQRYADEEGSPPIEVRRYPGTPVGDGPRCDTWVTSGMSDVALVDEEGDSLRRELVFYAPPGGDFTVGLRAIASYPFENETYLDHGHSIQSFGTLFVPGGADALLADDTARVELPHLVLLSPLVRQHRRIGEQLELDGQPLQLLWVVPISAAEHALKRKEGTSALLDLFERVRHPWLFNAKRRCYLGVQD